MAAVISADRRPGLIDIAAAGAVGQEFVYIFAFCCFCSTENVLTEGREGFKKLPGGRRIHTGRV